MQLLLIAYFSLRRVLYLEKKLIANHLLLKRKFPFHLVELFFFQTIWILTSRNPNKNCFPNEWKISFSYSKQCEDFLHKLKIALRSLLDDYLWLSSFKLYLIGMELLASSIFLWTRCMGKEHFRTLHAFFANFFQLLLLINFFLTFVMWKVAEIFQYLTACHTCFEE